MDKNETSQFYDILKGIGIFFVVIGHLAANIIPGFSHVNNIFTNYIYTYHLALFFFVAGCLYNESKYANSPSLLFINRFKRCYLPFFLYCFFVEIFFFLIPSFYNPGVEKNHYDLFVFLKHTISFSLMQRPSAPYAMSLWFIPTFILSCSFFGIIVFVGNYFKEKFKLKSDILKNILIILLSILLSLIGYCETKNYVKFPYRIELSFFVTPLLTLGYFIKKYIKNWDRFLNYYVAILFVFISIFLAYFFPCFSTFKRIDLKEEHFEYVQYFVLSILGIYQAMYFAKIILKNNFLRYIKSFFCLIGKASFEIMAFHRVAFFIINSYILFFLKKQKIDSEIVFNISLIFYAAIVCFLIAIIKKMFLKLKKA